MSLYKYCQPIIGDFIMEATLGLHERMKIESFHLRHELERFNNQVKFAEKLLELYPEKKGKFAKLIGNAVALVEGLPELSCYKQLQKRVRDAENIMSPIAKFAKTFTIHCVGHAHIDMNWMWSWPETVAATNDTFSTVLKLMEEYPDFIFSQSQASIYKIIEEYNPDLLKQIQTKVKEGRWEVTASHWVEGDKNMVNGETLSRQLLYTRKYMKKLFDLNPEDIAIDWAPDTFGHSAMVPAYLVRGGVRYSYMHRPGNLESKCPKAFWWKSNDGSKVLVRNDMIHGYNGRVSSDISLNLLEFIKETKGHEYMFVYGVGDHGGGPTRCDLNKIIDMAQWPVFPTIKFSTANTFFKALEREGKNLPILDSELNFEFTGCYTTQSLIKKANRFSENRLADAELAATIAWKSQKLEYPSAKLEKSWQNCLFNHFHDILPGSGVRDTRHYTMGLFQEIMTDTSMIETLSLRQMAASIDTSSAQTQNDQSAHPPIFYKDSFGAGVGIGAVAGNMSTAEQSTGSGNRPFILFNPTAADRSEVVEVTIWDNPVPEDNRQLKDREFSVQTPDGKIIPAQFINDGNLWGHSFIKLAFPVKLSGFSYALHVIVEDHSSKKAKTSLNVLQESHICVYSTNERATKFGGENEFISLEINPKTGGILHLHDKCSNIDIISPDQQLPMLEYAIERPHSMSSWLIDFADRVEQPLIKKISYLSHGPYKIAIRVDAKILNSEFSIIYEIQENNPQVNIYFKGTWLEFGSLEKGCPSLRMPFPLNLDAAKASYEIPFGAVERNLNSDEEVPALQWVRVQGKNKKQNAGCLLLNDCKHGHALDKNILRISLIRSTYDPDPTPELGAHEVHLALLPYSAKMSDAQATEIGQKFNHSIKIIGTDVHKGKLPATDNMIKISAENVIISGIKKAEQANAVILRLYEIEGQSKDIKISLSENIFGKIKSAGSVDLLERELDSKKVKLKAGDITVSVGKYEIVSLKIGF